MALTFLFNIMTFDSQEEIYYHQWLVELKEAGYIESFSREPVYQLYPEIKINNKTLLRESTYKPDFLVVWTEKAKDIFYFTEESVVKSLITELKSKHLAHKLESGLYYSLVDVKGTFAGRGNSTTIKFPMIQKQMYYRHKIYVNKIMPLHDKSGLFANTFTPKEYSYTKKGELRKRKWKLISLSEFINKQQNARR